MGHESRDDNVTVDNIEISQKTLTDLPPTHTSGPIEYKWSRVGYDLHFSVIRNYVTSRDSCPKIVLHQNRNNYMNSSIVIDIVL